MTKVSESTVILNNCKGIKSDLKKITNDQLKAGCVRSKTVVCFLCLLLILKDVN